MARRFFPSLKFGLQLGLVSLILFSCVFNSSKSDAKSAVLWQETTSNTPVKPLTTDLYVNIANKVDEAVVNISTVQTVKPVRQNPFGRGQGRGPTPFDDLFRDFFDRFGPREGMKRQSLGSGFIINSKGYIITNNHVVERADEIKIVLSNDKTFKAEIVGRDPKTDIALLKINPDKKTKLKVVPLGDSDKMRVGDIVVAIGNPFGLDHTLTSGLVSAKGRSINLGNYDDFIQTDASINPGNSGGPLLNINGQVIGINTAINAAGQGIGFAIPINMAKNIITQLYTKGKVTRGWLGVYITKVDEDLAKALDLERPMGAIVTDVQKGSPAEKAKFAKGDIILSFNGQKIDEFNDLPKVVATSPPGTKATVVILRDKKKITKTVTLGELPEEPVASGTKAPKENKLGIEVQDLTPDVARGLGIESDEKGVLVSNLSPSSPAGDKGLRRGDLIQEINRREIKNKRDYERVVASLKKGESVIIWYKRRGQTGYVAFAIK